LTKISIFAENFDFWPKFWFLTKISIFAENLYFFKTKYFNENFDFWRKFRFLTKIFIFGKKFHWIQFPFLTNKKNLVLLRSTCISRKFKRVGCSLFHEPSRYWEYDVKNSLWNSMWSTNYWNVRNVYLVTYFIWNYGMLYLGYYVRLVIWR